MVHRKKPNFLKQKSDNELNKNNTEIISKKGKIIVRNLPFKNLSEKSVRDLFKNYGEIVEVKLLRKDDGKFVGCGFVQFKEVSSASKAIQHCNLKEIHGRKIVVDWALPKTTFLNKIQNAEENFDLRELKKNVFCDSEVKTLDFEIDKNPDPLSGDNDESSNLSEEKVSIGESESDTESDNQMENEEEKDVFNKKLNNFSKENKSKILSTDVEEGKTVFIRNVPFYATNEDLKKCFECFGPLEYALICVDKLTEHSKGTAFVKFKDKESVFECLKNSSKLFLHDNLLNVVMAVSKQNLENKKRAEKMPRDSRNLYLVREGVIIAGSKAATGMSASDKTKRIQLEKWKSQILKNLNMFVSKTRLVVHNLPRTFTDVKLKQLFLKYGNPKAVIREAKVMYDRKKNDSTGNQVSKEVGFVSFTNHEDALTALRNINNNPNIFNPKKRPIVAFSIENRAVLNSKKRNLEKSKAKSGLSLNDKLSKLNKRQRRFIKRKQKIIEKRKEAKIEKMKQTPKQNIL